MTVVLGVVWAALLIVWAARRGWAEHDPRSWLPDAASAAFGTVGVGWLGTAALLYGIYPQIVSGEQPVRSAMATALWPLQAALVAGLSMLLAMGVVFLRSKTPYRRAPRSWAWSMVGVGVLALTGISLFFGIGNAYGLGGLYPAGVSGNADTAEWIYGYLAGPNLSAVLMVVFSLLFPALRAGFGRVGRLGGELDALLDELGELQATPEIATLMRRVEEMRAGLQENAFGIEGLIGAARAVFPLEEALEEGSPEDVVTRLRQEVRLKEIGSRARGASRQEA